MRTCPDCYVELNLSNREGVQIDYCPTCRGIWLDHGELEKIIQLAIRAPYQSYGGHSQSHQTHYSQPSSYEHSSHGHHDHHHSKHGHHHGHYKKHKHEHPVADFLEDIFDIFD